MKRIQAGTTREFYWVNSGQTPSPIIFNLLDGTESLVNSGPFVSSGNGHYYYRCPIPSSEGFYVGKSIAVIGSDSYTNRISFRSVFNEVD